MGFPSKIKGEKKIEKYEDDLIGEVAAMWGKKK